MAKTEPEILINITAKVSRAIVLGTTEKVLKKYLADSLVGVIMADIKAELKSRDSEEHDQHGVQSAKAVVDAVIEERKKRDTQGGQTT